MKTIVALVDFSDVTFKLLRHAHQLASAFQSHLILLHVVDLGLSESLIYPENEELVNEDSQKLAEMQESLTKLGIQVTARQMHGGSIKNLVDECARLQANLIMVGSHGHGNIYNLIVGSVTSEVLKHAVCPVFVVPSRAHDADAELTEEARASTDKEPEIIPAISPQPIPL